MRKREGELQMNCFLKIIALSRGFYYLCAQMRISPTKKKQSIAENRWSNSGRLGLLQSINSKKYSHLSNLFDSWWHHSCKFHFPYTFVEGVGVFFLYTLSSVRLFRVPSISSWAFAQGALGRTASEMSRGGIRL